MAPPPHAFFCGGGTEPIGRGPGDLCFTGAKKATCAQVSGVTPAASGDITAMMPRVQRWHAPSAHLAQRFKRRLQRARSPDATAALALLSLRAHSRT